MPTRIELLNDLRKYPPEKIAEAIRTGVVTMYELSKSGNLTPLFRRRIEERLSSEESTEVQLEPEVATADSDTASTQPQGDQKKDDIEIPKAADIEIPSFLSVPVTTSVASDDELSLETEQVPPKKKNPAGTNKGMFNRPFSFSGRIRRTEYGLSFIIYFIWSVIIQSMSKSPNVPPEAAVIPLIMYIPMLWFAWAQNCKRCHDRGHSGWYQLIPFYFLVLLFGDGDKGCNEYGDNPKE